MTINGFFTQQGLVLAAKLAAGGTLAITRITAGSGETADTAASLSKEYQTLAVNSPTHTENTATISATLVPARADEGYSLTELGVYANDPDNGEILYKVYRLDTPMHISTESTACLRFYLNETISTDENVAVTCSPAGLVTEAMFQPVEQAVLTTATSIISVALDAGDLPAYLRALPRFLDKVYFITVAGTLSEELRISDFHGNGFLRIEASSPGDCVLQGGVLVENCSAAVQLWNLHIHSSTLSGNNNLVKVTSCGSVYLYACSLAGSSSSGGRCLYAEYGSRITIRDCSLSNASVGVLASFSSIISISADNGGTFSGLNRGVWVWNGGIVLLGSNVPDLLGASSNTKQGGLIARSNGTLL